MAQALVDHEREEAAPALLGDPGDVRRDEDVRQLRREASRAGIGSGSKTSRQAMMSPRLRRARSARAVDDLATRDVDEHAARARAGRAPRPRASPRSPAVSGTRTKTTSHPSTSRAARTRLRRSRRTPSGTNGSKTRHSRPGRAGAARSDDHRYSRSRSGRRACGSARPVEARTGALADGRKAFSWAIMRRKLAPALRSPTRARPSAHSAVGHDEPWLVSTTRTPRLRGCLDVEAVGEAVALELAEQAQPRGAPREPPR